MTGAVTDGASRLRWIRGGFGLTVAAGGSVAAPSVSLSGGGIVVAGGVAGSGSATLASGSTIDIPGSLSGGTVDLTAGTDIGVSGGLSGGTIDASAGTSFNETGASISAPTIRVTAPAIALNGGSVLTGATSVPGGTLSPGQIPDGSGPGLFLSAATLAQTGTTLVNGGGTAGTIRVGSLAGGAGVTANFNQLQALSSNLYLVLGSGSAAGGIAVQGLEVAYGGAGNARLAGSVNRQTGQAAAAASFITPGISSNYQMNGCVIAASTCSIVIPVPPVTPLTPGPTVTPAVPSTPVSVTIPTPIATPTPILPPSNLFIRPPAVFLLTDLAMMQFYSSSLSSAAGTRDASFTIFPLTDTGWDSTSDQEENVDDILPDIADRDF